MTEKDFNDFGLFAKDRGISSMNLYYANKRLEHNSMTPYIIEERQMNMTQLDVFSRLMVDRILWAAGEVNDNMSTIIQAQLMFLDNLNNEDITLHLDTGGGSIKSGLGIVDLMDYIKSDVMTVNTGMCASMGAVLLGAGKKGKRKSLRFSRTMIHQSSSGLQGTFKDATIGYNEWAKINNQIFQLLGEYTDKDPEVIKIDADRDLWFNAQETLEYGLIDGIIQKKQ
jgi:ATP-dependent Clp protease protease subunit